MFSGRWWHLLNDFCNRTNPPHNQWLVGFCAPSFLCVGSPEWQCHSFLRFRGHSGSLLFIGLTKRRVHFKSTQWRGAGLYQLNLTFVFDELYWGFAYSVRKTDRRSVCSMLLFHILSLPLFCPVWTSGIFLLIFKVLSFLPGYNPSTMLPERNGERQMMSFANDIGKKKKIHSSTASNLTFSYY